MRVTPDDLAVVLVFCLLLPLVGLGLSLTLVPVFMAWVLHLAGA